MRTYTITCLVFFGALRGLWAQPLAIRVADEEKRPLIGANVQLTYLPDSSLWLGVTDLDGAALFSDLPAGLYGIQISYIGYETLDGKAEIPGPEPGVMQFFLKESSVALSAVTVTAKRPLIRQEGDKMIVDPEPLASISSNALEVLETVPGMFVDPDGGIFLNNATPAQIYINGREQRMSQQDMASILRSLPPGSIQRIEVLRTPSTRYDAASSGGIVNIILKKGFKLGRFGSVNAGFNQGACGDRFAGFSLNDSGDKRNWYINGNYNHNSREDTGGQLRSLSEDYNLGQTTRTLSQNNQGNVGYGINFDLDDRLNLSYDGRLNGSVDRSDSRNLVRITGADAVPLSEIDNRTGNYSPSLNLQQDLGLTWKLDTLGSEWDTKAGYSYRSGRTDQDFSADILFPAVEPTAGEGSNRQGRHFYLLQTDLTWNFPDRTQLETGLKTTYQDYDSRANYFLRENGSLITDERRTNAFNYRENISAAYLQASRPLFAGILLKGGLRLEHTRMQGNQTVPADTSFLINRVDFFPYVYLSRPIINIAGFDVTAFLIYRRTINRPGYGELNPYIQYLDEFSYETGNPGLQPQFTQTLEANISANDRPLFAIGRNFTDGIQTSVVYPDAERPEIIARTYDNVGQSRETYFRAVAGIPPGGVYFFVAGGQYNLNEYDGLYLGQPLSFRRGSWRLFTFHSLTLSKTTRFTLSGFMWINGLQNFLELENLGQINLSFNQDFLKKKLRVSVFARDVLRTRETRFSFDQGGILFSGDRYNDSQRIGMRIRYEAGIKKREERMDMMRFDAGE